MKVTHQHTQGYNTERGTDATEPINLVIVVSLMFANG